MRVSGGAVVQLAVPYVCRSCCLCDTAQPLGIVVASRLAAVTESFGEALARLLGRDRLLLLELGPLDRDDGVRLVRGLAPGRG